MLPPPFDACGHLRRAIVEDPADDAPRLALADWFEQNGRVVWAETIRKEVRNGVVARGPLPGPFQGRAVFRRGFVEIVTIELDPFLVHGAEIFAEQPITQVAFTDLDPEFGIFGFDTWGWITGFIETEDTVIDIDLALMEFRKALLPDPLAGELEGPEVTGDVFKGRKYGSHAAAVEALSQAAVRIGREAAGLSPLVTAPTTIIT